jgi:hypothetical protein
MKRRYAAQYLTRRLRNSVEMATGVMLSRLLRKKKQSTARTQKQNRKNSIQI